MAFVDNTQDPNNPNNLQNQAGAPGLAPQAPQTSTGTSNASSSGPAPKAQGQGVASQPVQSKAPPFQDLGAYLTANAPQTQALGQQVAQNITNTGQAAQTAVDQSANAFNQAVTGGTVNLNQDLVNSAATNPTQFVSNPGNVTDFQKQLNATYKGPTDFTQSADYNNVNTSIQNAVNMAQSATQPGGVQNLVAGLEAVPTQGVRTLDAMLLQQNPEAAKAIQTAATPNLTLNDYLNNAATSANTSAKAAADTTANTAKAVQDKFTGAGGVLPTWKQGLTDAQKQAETAREAYNQALSTGQTTAQTNKTNLLNLEQNLKPTVNSALTNAIGHRGPDLDAEIAKVAAQMSPDAKLGDLNSWINASPVVSPATLENTASADEFAKEQALSTLLGQNINFLNPTLADQAGTYKAGTLPTASTDTTNFSQYLNDLGSLYDSYAPETVDNFTKYTPQEIAKSAIDPYQIRTYGGQNTPGLIDALRRLSNGETA